MRDFDPTASEFISSGYLARSRPGGVLYEPTTILAGSALASGLLGASATSDAADTSAAASDRATASQRAMFDKVVDLESPFRQFGLDSGQKLSSLLGLNGGSGDLLHSFGAQDFQMDPGYQYQLKYGQQALQNSQAAKDGVLSGGALKGLIGFNQDYAGQAYQSAFDRYNANRKFTLGSLLDMTNLGQSAASNTAQTGPGFSSGIAQSITGAGQARAAGSVGVANALSGGLGGASNAYFLSSLLNKQNTPGAGVVSDGSSIADFA